MKGEVALLLFAVIAILIAGAIIHGGRLKKSGKNK